MADVAFLGMGVMGAPMAGHLAVAGHEVGVYNRTASKAKTWAKSHDGKAFPTPRDAAEGRDVVFACVGNDDDLRGVCLGENGAFAGMGEGAVFVDHTTVSAEVTRGIGGSGWKEGDFLGGCAGFGRAGGGGERTAGDHVRGKRRGLSAG